jgi:hypothetical protein
MRRKRMGCEICSIWKSERYCVELTALECQVVIIIIAFGHVQWYTGVRLEFESGRTMITNPQISECMSWVLLIILFPDFQLYLIILEWLWIYFERFVPFFFKTLDFLTTTFFCGYKSLYVYTSFAFVLIFFYFCLLSKYWRDTMMSESWLKQKVFFGGHFLFLFENLFNDLFMLTVCVWFVFGNFFIVIFIRSKYCLYPIVFNTFFPIFSCFFLSVGP